jgi:deoxyribonuclease-4
MANLQLGSHVGDENPIEQAQLLGIDHIQLFLGAPQSWKAPVIPHPDGADGLKAQAIAAGIDMYVHARYVINVATSNNKVRIPSRNAMAKQIAAAAAVGARGLIVHGGQVLAGDDLSIGFANWTKAADAVAEQMATTGVPVLIENTAGGDNSVARTLDSIARLWDAVGHTGIGFCLDTCHAWAAGLELPDAVDAVLAITGRIDLIHCNGSRDEFNSHRDRHSNLNDGHIPVDAIIEAVRRANTALILETPSDGHADDIATLQSALSVTS